MTPAPTPAEALTAAGLGGKLGRPIRLAVVTNIPAPYRVPIYDRVAAQPGIEFEAIYCAATEPDRYWDLPPAKHKQTFLSGRVYERAGRFIHYNPGVWRALRTFDPHVVVTTGFNPTHLLAYLYALVHGRPHVVMTDGTDASEARLSLLHRLIRRVVFATSRAFIVASHGGWRLLRAYRVRPEQIHFSPLCANTSVNWNLDSAPPRDIDLLFSGRLVESKNPAFALQVAAGVARMLGRKVRLVLLGRGPLEQALREQASKLEAEVEVTFAGHVSQAELPAWFVRARLFLFPTPGDVWGVVANEALLAGVPVIVSPHAGVAGELVLEDVNGRVLELQLDGWVNAAAAVLGDPGAHARYASAAQSRVAPYSFDNAAYGIIDAARAAVAHGTLTPRLSNFVRRPRVVCVQRRMTHYRVPMFEALRHYLNERGVELLVVQGDAAPSELQKNDGGRLPWATHAPCHYFLGERLCWQNVSAASEGTDLLIVTQENRMLFNLLAMSVRRPDRLAFWGYGRNFQSGRINSVRERFKRRTTRCVDWWFAYTELSAGLVASQGFAPERITTLGNSIDTTRLRTQCQSISAQEVEDFRSLWELGSGLVGVYIGSFTSEKRIAFLLQAATALARRVPGFHLVLVGDGPGLPDVQQAARADPAVRYVGAQFGREKALCLRSADVLLNPGAVGLGVLDAFAASKPLVTTDCRLHGPEIAYLQSGVNGLMTQDSLAAFIEGAEALLGDPKAREFIGAHAAQCAARHTLENMVRNFGNGMLAALKLPPR